MAQMTQRVIDYSKNTRSDKTKNTREIKTYYDETWLDYRLAWLNSTNRAIHIGYWDADTHSHAQSLLNMNRALAEAIGIQAGMRVLDAGCGVGGSAIWLAETYGVEVTGITLVESQLERAKRYAAERNVAHKVRFHLADFTATPFPAGTFDAVWAIESVCHSTEKQRFAHEARRVLRPGGRLGMAEYIRTGRPFDPADEALLMSWLNGWAVPDIWTSGEWTTGLESAGFTDIQIENVNAHVRPSLRRLYAMAVAAWPIGMAMTTLRLRSPVMQGNQRAAREQYRALRRGLWFYSLTTASVEVD